MSKEDKNIQWLLRRCGKYIQNILSGRCKLIRCIRIRGTSKPVVQPCLTIYCDENASAGGNGSKLHPYSSLQEARKFVKASGPHDEDIVYIDLTQK